MAAKTAPYFLGIFTLSCWRQQDSSAPSDSFEVTSVKPAATRELNGIYTYPGGRVECRGCWLAFLLQEAFKLQRFQLSGGPAWMDSERWDVLAKPPESSKWSQWRPPYPKAPPNDEQRRMLQSLLAERFQLKYHLKTKEGPVYLLVRSSRPLEMQDAKDKNVFPCSGGPGGGMIRGDGLAGINESMPDLAQRLSQYLERPVQD